MLSLVGAIARYRVDSQRLPGQWRNSKSATCWRTPMQVKQPQREARTALWAGGDPRKGLPMPPTGSTPQETGLPYPAVREVVDFVAGHFDHSVPNGRAAGAVRPDRAGKAADRRAVRRPEAAARRGARLVVQPASLPS